MSILSRRSSAAALAIMIAAALTSLPMLTSRAAADTGSCSGSAGTSIADCGFESPSLGTSPTFDYVYRPPGTAWTYTDSSGVTGDLSAFTFNQPAPEGTQAGFIQDTGSISQSITGWQGQTYILSFEAAQRFVGCQAVGSDPGCGPEDFRVLLDNQVIGSFVANTRTYTPMSTSFTTTGGSHTLTFQGINSEGADNTAFIDAVSLSGCGSTAGTTLADCGFENPTVTSQWPYLNYTYSPSGTPWTYVGGAGVTGNESGLTFSQWAPEGTQAGFIQGTGSASQSVSGWVGGQTYTLSFEAAQRLSGCATVNGDPGCGPEDFEVLLDDQVIGLFNADSGTYATMTASFTTTSGPHTLTFQGVNSEGADNAAFIDSVNLTRVTTGVSMTPAPADITTAATSSSGAPVSYTSPTASDSTGPVAVTCSPLPGSEFPIGTTTVTCTAEDTSVSPPASVSESFTVTVTDTPPTITAPDVTVPATSPQGAVVAYNPTASDLADGADPVICSPASGSFFPTGTTTVSCSATNKAGMSSQATFTVTVVGATGQISSVATQVQGVGAGSSLSAKISQVQSEVAAGDISGACSTLTSFINEVQAQSGKKLTTTDATTLIDEAAQIQAALGC